MTCTSTQRTGHNIRTNNSKLAWVIFDLGRFIYQKGCWFFFSSFQTIKYNFGDYAIRPSIWTCFGASPNNTPRSSHALSFPLWFRKEFLLPGLRQNTLSLKTHTHWWQAAHLGCTCVSWVGREVCVHFRNRKDHKVQNINKQPLMDAALWPLFCLRGLSQLQIFPSELFS